MEFLGGFKISNSGRFKKFERLIYIFHNCNLIDQILQYRDYILNKSYSENIL